MPLIFIILLSALFYTHFNRWVLLLTLLCLAVVFLICHLFFLKPWYDYNRKPNLRTETRLSFTENGVFFPTEQQQDTPGAILGYAPEEQQKNLHEEAEDTAPEDGEENQAGKKGFFSKAGLGALTKSGAKNDKSSMFKPRSKRKSHIRWDMFAEAWENRDFFFLIQQPHIYYIVPKRSFANEEELQYFLKMLYRRVGIVESVGPYSPGR